MRRSLDLVLFSTYNHSHILRRCFANQKTSSTDPFDGYTRSCHIKQQFVELQTTAADGSIKVRKVPTGLIDNSNEWIGDQMVRAHLKITHDFDLTMQGFAERARKRLLAKHKQRQVYVPVAYYLRSDWKIDVYVSELNGELYTLQSLLLNSITDEMIKRRGSLDLAVAHMVCDLGGRVQFVGEPLGCWHQSYNRGPPNLPSTYSDDLKLEIIDFSGTAVMYEGLEMLPRLTCLKMLRLRRCLYLNDHCLSLVGQITQSPLEYLDISECPRISANGVTALTELKSLRRLLIQGNPTMKDRELVCLLLEDYLPKVYIEGVDYLGNLPEDARQRVLALDVPEKPPLLAEHIENIEREGEADVLRVEVAVTNMDRFAFAPMTTTDFVTKILNVKEEFLRIAETVNDDVRSASQFFDSVFVESVLPPNFNFNSKSELSENIGNYSLLKDRNNHCRTPSETANSNPITENEADLVRLISDMSAEELIFLKNQLLLELNWLDQAINSRKQFLFSVFK
ncbi:unnamed protein product [Hydatigera taeniaeformis]|uniref:ATP synthase subunit s, mitochondrial n=1 Tax=Hydatigena taeniaeformis TaxID=6205 RepID=A0A0R3X5M6_HYDTA|nr:unnamed protein product [Hydatigera taeniaeformis]